LRYNRHLPSLSDSADFFVYYYETAAIRPARDRCNHLIAELGKPS
jgi:exonuclease I